MNQPNLNWFYFHIVLALIIIVKDYNGTLEESLNNFEKKIGLYTPPDTTEYEEAPYYIPPIEEVDSTWILPDSLKIKREENENRN
jgi:hypothetical protein